MSGKKTEIITKDNAIKTAESAKKSAKAAKPTEKSAATKSEKPAVKTQKSAAEKKTSSAKSVTKGGASTQKDAEKTSDTKSAAKPARTSAKAGAEKAPAKTTSAKSKASAKKKSAETAEKKPAKSRKKAEPKEEQKTGEPSSKTPQVMKLVQQRNDMVNPTIMAGKSSIPRRLRGLEPLSRIMKREAEEVFGGDEAETYNITALVIEEHSAEILRRFNACDCELCVETLSRLTAEVVPARFAKLRKRDVEFDAPEVKQLKAPLQKTVTSRMVRLVMQNKKRSYHD